jgi:thiamine-phosphate pyrophosphorylase
MRSRDALAVQARRLNHEAGAPGIPALFFFTDPHRTPDPIVAAKRLPRGTAVVFRHFGAPDRARTARRLAAACRSRGLVLLIAADPELARRVGADGVHWPEGLIPHRRDTAFRLVTAAAHSAPALTKARVATFDAAILAPVFPTRSPSGNPPLGLFHASQLARGAGLPVIAMGGVNADTARRLAGRGFAGVAAVEALAGG